MTQQTVPAEVYHPINEAGDIAHVSADLLRKLHRQGKGPARIRVGKKLILYPRSALDSWLASQADVSRATS